MSEKRFDFTHKGIGKLLKDERLIVPPNQRSYAWADDHIQELFEDLSLAVRQNEPDYFLGTVVLTQGKDGALEVADGQQRLATITILLARIRDYFLAQGRKPKAESISNDYLRAIDLNTEQAIPKLCLNVDDNEFFRNLIVLPQNERKKMPILHQSNERIDAAAKLAEEHIQSILKTYKPENHDAILVTWVKYLENQATVVVVTVPSYVDAFRMFETLNDRGLRASQADLLKNYMLSRARSRLAEAQTRWAAVTGALETISDDVDLVTYIRHFWITRDGPTRERELAERIKKNVVHDADAMDFLSQLEDSAQHYVALFNQGHSIWNSYRKAAREAVKVITRDLRVEQIRPLLFAVSRYFDEQEAEKAFRILISWSVRFLIVGGRGGMLDVQYARRAHEIGAGKIKNAKTLKDAMKSYIPNDAEFDAAFKVARVSQQWVARYYLRTLDLQAKGEPDPELIANEDQDAINLEHVMPLKPSPEWNVDPEILATYDKRLGNMALLKARTNLALANKSFREKKDAYKDSSYAVTSTIAQYDDWGPKEIEHHQEWLAQLAVKAWSI